MRNSQDALNAFVVLLIATIILYFLDPVIASAFGQPLTNSQFAASPAGGIWRLLEVLSDFNVEIVIAWIGYFLWLFEKV
jgi:hypothetical protein